MATSAFKSTTRRAPATTSSPTTDDSTSSSSSKSYRRSRSLSRFSRPIPLEFQPDVHPTPRRKFVNTIRGSVFPEISLDDLAIEFSPEKVTVSEAEDGRSGRVTRRNSEISPVTTSSQRRSRSVSRHNNGSTTAGGATGTASYQRRGRSVSRRNDGTAVIGCGTARAVPEASSRRRRSVSVACFHISDSESDIDQSRSSASQTKMRHVGNGNNRTASFQQPTASSQRRSGRSMGQTPGSRSHDGYSVQYSALTDDESRDAQYGKNEIEKTIRAVYAQKKIDHPTGDDVNHSLYEAMRKELRSAVNEIMTELGQAIERKPSALAANDQLHSNKSDVFQAVSSIRKKNATNLKSLAKDPSDMEPRGNDGSKIVREVLPDSKMNTQRSSRSRKRSNDRNRVSKRLDEEAEKYFEEFISNVEDTDFSSFEGERSDTSSTLGGITKRKDGALPSQYARSAVGCDSLSAEMDGINLPWLKWDNHDVSPRSGHNKSQPPVTPKALLWDPSKDLNLIQKQSSESSSSCGLWNPELVDVHTASGRENKSREVKSQPRFDMERYGELQRDEEVLFERWREGKRISSGGLLVCGNGLVDFL